MRAQRVRAIARRQSYVLRRAPQRWFDVIVWPVVDAILFGAIGVYFGRQHGTAAASAAFLLAGIVLFHVVFQAEISLATGFLEETWSRNLLNLMVTPLTELEYGAGVVLFGYPLHPPGKPDVLRVAHLPRVSVPLLFVQGSRDAFGSPAELSPHLRGLALGTRLFVVEGGDHSLAVRKGAGAAEISARVADEVVRFVSAVSA